MAMAREEYLAKRKAYYQQNKYKWKEYALSHREEINAKNRERRARNLDHYRAKAKEWRDNNKEKISVYGKKYHYSKKGQETYKKYYELHKIDFIERANKSRSTHKDEARANHIVNNNIAKGKIQKQPCEQCGKIKAEAHHDDYNRPLEVRWLCRRCHAEWHSKNEPIRSINQKKCIVCGELFTFTHRAQKFCSTECKKKWYKEYHHKRYLEKKPVKRTGV